MTVFAHGDEKVRAIQHALGGHPPSEALENSKFELKRYFDECSEKRRSAHAEFAALAERSRELLFRHVAKDDAGLQENKREAKALFEHRRKHKVDKPSALPFEPRIIIGSNFWFKAPPYDDQFAVTTHGSFEHAQAIAADGSYELEAHSDGEGAQEVAAGVATHFYSVADDPQQRFAALLRFSDSWWDAAQYYVAHNNLRTRLWVWGVNENRWVVQSDVLPSWSDGVGWLEQHNNDDSGTISIETFFPAAANSWYVGWVWSDLSVFADSGFWGTAASVGQFTALVPFVVFGSLW